MLTSAEELAHLLTTGAPPTLLDVRWRLGGPPARVDYDAGHLPGAVFIDLDRDLAGPPGASGRHPMPDTDLFGEAMRRAGVRSGTPVVCYDDRDGTSSARCWWLLRYFGHPHVSVLDGGVAGWTARGQALTATPADPPSGDFQPDPGHLPVLDAASAAELARNGILLDARAGERYRGESEPVDPVAGHVPGAVTAPTGLNVDGDGRFLPPQQLRQRFARLGAAGDAPVGVYCGSGVTAAHEVLALELAGTAAALYVGSWSEWISDPGRPVAIGPDPG